MATRIAVIHTAASAMKLVGDQFKEVLPEAEVINILDDSIVPDAVKAGKIDHNLAERMYTHFSAAEKSGAEVIMLACSTVGETADVARQLIPTPITRIDDAMCEKAVTLGKRIGVLATVASTLAPTTRLIQRKAVEAGKDVELKTRLVEGAWQILTNGDMATHDDMVIKAVKELARDSDVVVLAQATISRVLPQLGDIGVPVLSSPRLGVERVKQMLQAKR
jgi:aspartate/glutamate racemase